MWEIANARFGGFKALARAETEHKNENWFEIKIAERITGATLKFLCNTDILLLKYTYKKCQRTCEIALRVCTSSLFVGWISGYFPFTLANGDKAIEQRLIQSVNVCPRESIPGSKDGFLQLRNCLVLHPLGIDHTPHLYPDIFYNVYVWGLGRPIQKLDVTSF